MAELLFSKRYSDQVARLRVPCGFVLAALFLLFSAPSGRSLAVGLAIAALGLALRGWAAGHLRKDSTLTTSGPYAFIRNPLYAGTLTAAMGLAIAANRVWLAVLFGAFFLLVYLPAIQLEQQHLRDLFGARFDRYANQVRMLIPRVPPLVSDRRFEWSLYKRNREYQALAGFTAGAAFLVAKWLWLGGG